MNKTYYICYGWEDSDGEWHDAYKENIPTLEEANETAEQLKADGYEIGEIDFERD